MKDILLVAYKFPPYSQVGAFRWTQLSKYLAKLGHRIHVVTVDWNMEDIHGFLGGLDIPGITIHRIPSGYLHNLKYRKIKNRYLNVSKNIFLKFVLDKYVFWDDEAQHWGKHLIPYCKKLIDSQNIETIIATGGPFQANYWASIVKMQVREVSLIQDFRDPWHFNQLKRISDRQSRKVYEWQKQSIERSDAVVAVTKGLLKEYVDGTKCDTSVVIPNGYDPNIISQTDAEKNKGALVSFAHVGNVTNRREVPFIAFLKAIESNLAEFRDVKVTLVGVVSKSIIKGFDRLIKARILNIVPPTGQKEALEILSTHQYALQLNADICPQLVSTKIYEYGALKIPTVSINYGGDIDLIIKKYNLGYSINLNRNDDIYTFIKQLYTTSSSKQFKFNVEEFSYPKLARQYSELIQSI